MSAWQVLNLRTMALPTELHAVSAPYACPRRRHLFVYGIASCVPDATVCGCSELAETWGVDRQLPDTRKATYMGVWVAWGMTKAAEDDPLAAWIRRQCSNISFRVAGFSHILSRPSRRVAARGSKILDVVPGHLERPQRPHLPVPRPPVDGFL